MAIFSPRCFISIRRLVVTLRAESTVFVDIVKSFTTDCPSEFFNGMSGFVAQS